MDSAQIYLEYSPKVLRFIAGKINNPTVAEDLCADVFLKVYEKADTFDETKASLSTWIFTIARNRVTDYFRTNRITDEIPEDLAEEGTPETALLNSEMLDTLADALEDLPERERDLVILHYYSGVPLKEVAQRLDVSYSYCKILHNKALESMRRFFE